MALPAMLDPDDIAASIELAEFMSRVRLPKGTKLITEPGQPGIRIVLPGHTYASQFRLVQVRPSRL